jgi:hypothetical protein
LPDRYRSRFWGWQGRMASMIQIREIDHVVLRVSDLEAMLR